MFSAIKKITIFTAVLAALAAFSGCSSIDSYYSAPDGRVGYGGAMTLPSEENAPETNEEPRITLYTGDEIPDALPETLPETLPEPETEEQPDTDMPDVSDVVEPLAVETSAMPEQRDYSALDTECHGYGQGVRFDELNRPKGAVEFNSGYSGFSAEAIRDTEEKTINLTFDQGYENGYTSKILDTLKEKGVKATFFVVGDYVEREPELVKRMIDEGHVVGSHSVHHYSMPSLSPEECVSEIMELHNEVLEKFGVQMNLFRPPKGEYSEQSLAVTGDLGYKTVLWSFAYADWDPQSQPEPEASLNKLIERAHPGAIYLLHSVSETNASILGDFIDAMLAEGYTFSTEF